MVGGCTKVGPHVARKNSYGIVSKMFLHYFVSVTSGENVTTQWKQAVRVDVTHNEYDFMQRIKIST